MRSDDLDPYTKRLFPPQIVALGFLTPKGVSRHPLVIKPRENNGSLSDCLRLVDNNFDLSHCSLKARSIEGLLLGTRELRDISWLNVRLTFLEAMLVY